MRLQYDAEDRSHITITRKAPGVYRIDASNANFQWGSMEMVSREIPNIERLVFEIEGLAKTLIANLDPPKS